MVSEKFIAVIGVDELEAARIRLMLRIIESQLDQRWSWGDDDNADLVIVNPDKLQGQIARNRAYSSGRRCAILGSDEPLRQGEVRLQRPVSADGMLELLSHAGAESANPINRISQDKSEFYESGEFEPQFEIPAEEPRNVSNRHQHNLHAEGLDGLLKSDQVNASQSDLPTVGLEVQAAPKSDQSARRERLASAAIFTHGNVAAEGIDLRSSEATPDMAPRTLREALSGNVVGGPATLQLPDAPTLTLDPKAQVFYADATLSALAPGCRASLAAQDCRRITTAELTRLRETYAARPYACLVWLDAFVHSEGRLAKHLDPGGRYVLRQAPGFESDFPQHDRILQSLDEPRRLNEIAAASAASMSQVFDLINALDAVGLIHVIPRLPRHDPVPSSSPREWFRSRFHKR